MTEEQYDILDERGKKTGQVLPKSQVHEQELWHGSAFVWIYNSHGEVLLQLRAEDKKCFPGVWDVSVAGHMAAGDGPEETIIREVKEEIGVEVSADELTYVDLASDVVPMLPDKTHPEFCWVYTMHRDLNVEDLEVQQSELTQVKWMSIHDLLADLEKPGHDQIYAARNPRVFAKVLERIQREN